MTRLIKIPPSFQRHDLIRRQPTNANFRDRTGEKLNGCTVIGYAGILPPSFSAWLCRCDCGKHFLARSTHLNHPKVGCGCRQQTVNALNGSVVHRAWKKMVGSCYQRSHPQYAGHGALGIGVCKQWRDSVARFAADVGERPNLFGLPG